MVLCNPYESATTHHHMSTRTDPVPAATALILPSLPVSMMTDIYSSRFHHHRPQDTQSRKTHWHIHL